MNHTKWAETERAYQVRKLLGSGPWKSAVQVLIHYFAKVKLHGTNASIKVTTGDGDGDDIQVLYQNRNRIVGVRGQEPLEEFFGFPKFADEFDVRPTVAHFQDKLDDGHEVMIYGEFAGPGIQKLVACSQVEKPFFAIYAIRVNPPGATDDGIGPELESQKRIIVDPAEISGIVGSQNDLIKVLPWFDMGKWSGSVGVDASGEPHTVAIEYKDPLEYDRMMGVVDEMVLDVEACDPAVKEWFGIEGIGEGLVFYPVSIETTETKNDGREFDLDVKGGCYPLFANLFFKAKGEKHEKNKQKTGPKPLTEKEKLAITTAGEVATDTILDGLWVTTFGSSDDADYEAPDPQRIPDWMKAVGSHFKGGQEMPEVQAMLEERGLAWKDIAKHVNQVGVHFFKVKVGMVRE